jgi:hypothetical protein
MSERRELLDAVAKARAAIRLDEAMSDASELSALEEAITDLVRFDCAARSSGPSEAVAFVPMDEDGDFYWRATRISAAGALKAMPEMYAGYDGHDLVTVPLYRASPPRAVEVSEEVCSCDEWEPGTRKLNEPLFLAQARNPHLTGTPEFAFTPFRYCPWCGKTSRAALSRPGGQP